MKLHIDIEMTPEELRRFLGLPDLSSLQEEWLSRFRDQATGSGLPSGEAAELMKPLLANNAAAMEAFNRAFWNAFAGASKASAKAGADDGDANDA